MRVTARPGEPFPSRGRAGGGHGLIPKEETDCTTESTENTENDWRCFFEKKKTLFFSVFSVLSVVNAVAVFIIAAPA